MTHKQPFDIYIASCDKNGGIYRYCISEDSFSLKSFAQIDRPMYITISDGKLYALLREYGASSESAIVSFDVCENGELKNQSMPLTTHGLVACHLCIDSNEIYAVNYISGSVIKMPDRLITHTGNGLDKKRQDAPHTHFICFTPDKKYLLTADLGIDEITTYDRELNAVSACKVPAGHGVRHLAFDDTGRYVFSANELGSTVSAFRYSDGKLTNINTINSLLNGNENNYPAAIRFCNNQLYVSNRGDDSISCFEWNGEQLLLKNVVKCGGISPRDFNIFGNILVCTNEKSDNVTMFKINGNNLLKLKSEIHMKSPLCVI